MIGLLNKIPPNAKHSFVAILGIALGFMVSRQEHFNIVFESMDGALTYLSIMSSVSFAILAVLMVFPRLIKSPYKMENGLSVFSLKDFSMMLASEGGLRKAQERMGLVKIGMSTMRAVFQDKEDSFEMKSHSMSDVPESSFSSAHKEPL